MSAATINTLNGWCSFGRHGRCPYVWGPDHWKFQCLCACHLTAEQRGELPLDLTEL